MPNHRPSDQTIPMLEDIDSQEQLQCNQAGQRSLKAVPLPPKATSLPEWNHNSLYRNNTITDGGVAPQCTFARPT